jgi:hypothetical protein
MLPFQHVSGLAVVKCARRRVPADYGEVLAIVLGWQVAHSFWLVLTAPKDACRPRLAAIRPAISL